MAFPIGSTNNFNIPVYRQPNNVGKQAKTNNIVTEEIAKKISIEEVTIKNEKAYNYEKLRTHIEARKVGVKEVRASVEGRKTMHADLRNLLSSGDTIAYLAKLKIRNDDVIYNHNGVIVPNGFKLAADVREEIKAINNKVQDKGQYVQDERIISNKLLKPVDDEAIALNKELETIHEEIVAINIEIASNNKDFKQIFRSGSSLVHGVLSSYYGEMTVEAAYEQDIADMMAEKKANEKAIAINGKIANMIKFILDNLADQPVDELTN
jgi:SMC interacting uncharacterized protein involved in chromosome segregation